MPTIAKTATVGAANVGAWLQARPAFVFQLTRHEEFQSQAEARHLLEQKLRLSGGDTPLTSATSPPASAPEIGPAPPGSPATRSSRSPAADCAFLPCSTAPGPQSGSRTRKSRTAIREIGSAPPWSFPMVAPRGATTAESERNPPPAQTSESCGSPNYEFWSPAWPCALFATP